MKNLSLAALLLLAFVCSCTKKEPADLYPADSPKANYDTAAIDSFSTGAVSVDIARKIRMSSAKYQDSLKEALKLQEQEKKLKDELDKENKSKADAEKKKSEAEKKLKTPETPAASETKTEKTQ